MQIYTASHCIGCVDALALAAEIAQAFPSVRVEVTDVEQPGIDLPAEVFATPTYLWDGQVFSLGNPERDALLAMIAARAQTESAP
ncbi:MAG: hypothetical protein HYR71_09345 [Chloroflexi bacterium]|nr:hypothetical protein [Chloroflexota bacterium]